MEGLVVLVASEMHHLFKLLRALLSEALEPVLSCRNMNPIPALCGIPGCAQR